MARYVFVLPADREQLVALIARLRQELADEWVKCDAAGWTGERRPKSVMKLNARIAHYVRVLLEADAGCGMMPVGGQQ